MNIRPLILTVATVAFSIFTGCNKPAPAGPPTIHYGRDACAECGMIISDERFAAAPLATHDGEPRALLFDDPGEQLRYHHAHPQAKISAAYVHDFTTKQWTDAATAHYLKSDTIDTPMGTGLVAFATQASALVAQTQHGGQLLTPTTAADAATTPRPASARAD